jgi:chitinase
MEESINIICDCITDHIYINKHIYVYIKFFYLTDSKLSYLFKFALFFQVYSITMSTIQLWTINTYYSVGTLVIYETSTYKCLQAHTSQEAWNPKDAPSLWSLQSSTEPPPEQPPIPPDSSTNPPDSGSNIPPPIASTTTGKRAIYYHTSWSCYARNFQVSDIPDEVTDIAYAFFNVDANGNIFSGDPYADFDKRYTDSSSVPPPDSWNTDGGTYGNFGQFMKLQAIRPINIQLAIGGWTWSKYFSPAVATAENRTNMVNSIINLFLKYNIFSGISIDWEYVSDDGINYGNDGNMADPADFDNLCLFIKELRTKFDARGMTHRINMCYTAAPEKLKFDVAKIEPLIDEFHIMTYDFHSGAWGETTTAFHANPRKSSYGEYSAEEAADMYLDAGVPAKKIFIGAAFYSRGFANTTGPGMPAEGGSPDTSWEPGCVDYKALPLPGATEYNDPESKSAYSYDADKGIVNTYDNVTSCIEKCKIVYEKNLGGVLVWESSGDKPYGDSRSLVKTFHDYLTNGRPSDIPENPDIPEVPPAEIPPVDDIQEWQPNTLYRVSNTVKYEGDAYVYTDHHISSECATPNEIDSTWKKL